MRKTASEFDVGLNAIIKNKFPHCSVDDNLLKNELVASLAYRLGLSVWLRSRAINWVCWFRRISVSSFSSIVMPRCLLVFEFFRSFSFSPSSVCRFYSSIFIVSRAHIFLLLFYVIECPIFLSVQSRVKSEIFCVLSCCSNGDAD